MDKIPKQNRAGVVSEQNWKVLLRHSIKILNIEREQAFAWRFAITQTCKFWVELFFESP